MVRCLVCHRQLKSPESIQRKIGTTCFNRLMKLTSEDKKKKKARQKANKGKAELIKGQINMFEALNKMEV
jgi:hypothetical protein